MTTLRNMEKSTLLKSLLTDSLVKREGLDLLHLMTMILWIKLYVSKLHFASSFDSINPCSHGNCVKLNLNHSNCKAKLKKIMGLVMCMNICYIIVLVNCVGTCILNEYWLFLLKNCMVVWGF